MIGVQHRTGFVKLNVHILRTLYKICKCVCVCVCVCFTSITKFIHTNTFLILYRTVPDCTGRTFRDAKFN
jgi:hypothetical protein